MTLTSKPLAVIVLVILFGGICLLICDGLVGNQIDKIPSRSQKVSLLVRQILRIFAAHILLVTLPIHSM